MTSLSKLVVDDARFLREAAVCGLGIVMLPELLVVDELADGRLMRVLDDFQAIELAVHALHPHGRSRPPASEHSSINWRSAFRDLLWKNERSP